MSKIELRSKRVNGTTGGIIVKNSKILLTRRNKKITEGGKWSLPGGHIKYGEKAEDAIKREVKEETGLNVKKAKFLFYFDESIPRIKIHNLTLIFLIKTSGNPQPNREVSEMKWFSKKEIEKMNLAFYNKDILKKFFRKNF